MRYNSESLEIKDLRSRNDVLYKDIKISLGLLITARKQHAEYRGNRNFGLSTTVNNRIMIFVIEINIISLPCQSSGFGLFFINNFASNGRFHLNFQTLKPYN